MFATYVLCVVCIFVWGYFKLRLLSKIAQHPLENPDIEQGRV